MTRSRRLAVLVLGLTLSVAAPRGAGAQGEVVDGDGDGVPDAADACPDTDAGDLVGADGCSACVCEVGWSSHRDYVRCVAGEARRRVEDGTLRPRVARAAVRRARRATCGDADLTRCCVYASDEDDVGSCRVMSADACDRLGDRVDAEDAGPGSCAASVCAF